MMNFIKAALAVIAVYHMLMLAPTMLCVVVVVFPLAVAIVALVLYEA